MSQSNMDHYGRWEEDRDARWDAYRDAQTAARDAMKEVQEVESQIEADLINLCGQLDRHATALENLLSDVKRCREGLDHGSLVRRLMSTGTALYGTPADKLIRNSEFGKAAQGIVA